MRSLKVCLWLLALLTLSGLLLMFCYVPSAAPPAVPASSTQFAVAAVSAHLVRTIFVKTNRRRTGWAVVLVLLTGLLWFTGFLLPWDQLASWMQRSMLPNISAQGALWSVYWTHTLILSLLTLPFLLVYVRRTRHDLVPSA